MSGKSELDIFTDISPQIVAESAIFQDVYPSTAIDSTTTNIKFVIQPSLTDYLDLNDTLLSMRVSVVMGDGSNIAKADIDKVVPTNYFLNALFENVSLSLNNVEIESYAKLYPYKATIETALNFNTESKAIQLVPAGYSDEEDERKKWVGRSVEFEIVGTLRLDFLNQPKYLIPGVSVEINLTKSNDSFALTVPTGTAYDGTSAWKVMIKHAMLYVRRVKVHPSVEAGHRHGLKNKNAIYPYTRSRIIAYSIPTGSTNYIKENIFSSASLPKLIVVGMVRADSYNGAYDKDPFQFEHFDCHHVSLHLDGQGVPYKRAYNTNFANKHFTDVYIRSMIQNLQMLNTNHSHGISISDFADGYTFFTFNLCPDFDYKNVQKIRDGNLRLDIRFNKALPSAINVFVYGLFDVKLQITGNREIIKDAYW
jgi:hypothetical protein